MRIEVLTPRLEVEPGATCEVELEVFNTGEVIDTVTSRVVGTYPLTLEQRPSAISLFPGTSERIVVAFTLPDDYPAGDHLVPVELLSAVAPGVRGAEVEVALDVAPVVGGSLDLVPSDVTCGRRAKLSAHVANTGNTPLNLALSGNDLERALQFSFDPPFVRVQPGQHVYVAAHARGKRPFFGMPITRQFQIAADGPGVTFTANGRVSQKPWVARGMITALTLALIIALWAVVFTAGAELVLAKDKLTKAVPAAFLIGQQDISSAAVAGSMGGTVTSVNDGLPVERMTVEAYRIRTGRQELMRSAATVTDGTWTLDGVLPGRYRLRFSAPGYRDVWYPDASSTDAAGIIQVRPVAETVGLDVKIAGLPGSISGAVAAGEQEQIDAIVSVRAVKADKSTELVTEVRTAADGTFQAADLPTPGTYELTYSMNGFTDQVVATALTGGQAHVVNTVQMAAGEGVLGGTVTSAGTPLGGVLVTVVGGGKTFTATTPTSGPVGLWSVGGLPTPGTYVVTFALEGYGTETMALDLSAGDARTDVDVAMVSGTGSIDGTVRDSAGAPLGDVNVTVTGSSTPIATKTLTTGDVGVYTLAGLATPGRYTVTFSLDGFAPVTRAVDLSDSGAASAIDVVLTRSTGSVAGTVSSGGRALAGAAITLGDGKADRATSSADIPAGGYRFDGLPAGSYTITVDLQGYKRRTVLVVIDAGAVSTQDIALEPAG